MGEGEGTAGKVIVKFCVVAAEFVGQIAAGVRKRESDSWNYWKESRSWLGGNPANLCAELMECESAFR